MTAVGVIYACSAALLKLPASATRINVSSWGLYIVITILVHFFFYHNIDLSKNHYKFEAAILLFNFQDYVISGICQMVIRKPHPFSKLHFFLPKHYICAKLNIDQCFYIILTIFTVHIHRLKNPNYLYFSI